MNWWIELAGVIPFPRNGMIIHTKSKSKNLIQSVIYYKRTFDGQCCYQLVVYIYNYMMESFLAWLTNGQAVTRSCLINQLASLEATLVWIKVLHRKWNDTSRSKRRRRHFSNAHSSIIGKKCSNQKNFCQKHKKMCLGNVMLKCRHPCADADGFGASYWL